MNSFTPKNAINAPPMHEIAKNFFRGSVTP